MKKKILVIALMTLVLLTGCMKNEKGNSNKKTTSTTTLKFTEDKQSEKDKYGQIRLYQDDEILITAEQYNKILVGMTEEEVWKIIGGKCKNKTESNQGNSVSYNCNGKGSDFASVLLMFNNGKFSFKFQTGMNI